MKDYKIFTIHDRKTGKTKYYLRHKDSASRVISKARWFDMYDKNTEVLPPLTLN